VKIDHDSELSCGRGKYRARSAPEFCDDLNVDQNAARRRGRALVYR
jgi:hypothetical protein